MSSRGSGQAVKERTATLGKLTANENFSCFSELVQLLTEIYQAHIDAGDDEKRREEIVEALDSEEGADIIVRIISSLSKGEPTTTGRECVYKCFCILWDFSDTRGEFIKNLMSTDIVSHCVQNLKNEEELAVYKKGKDIIKGSLGILYNVSREEDARERLGQHDWTCLNPYKEGEDEYLQALSAMTLAFLSDEDTEGILGERETTQYIVKLLQAAEKDPKRRKQGFTCTELIEGLARLALNDENKKTALESDGLPLLMRFVKSSDGSEQEAAAKCLWTLAFDDSVKAELVNYRGDLEDVRSSSDNEELNESLRGIMRTLDSDEPRKAGGHQGHIMISYAWSGDYGPETARRIAKYLKKCGYKVWIDIDQMAGSIIDSMVNALNDTKIFILCISDAYRRSNNCRLEATYAHRFGKTMIPVILESPKSSKGDWLTLLQRDMKYVEIKKGMKFNEKCEELRGEIQFYMGGTHTPHRDEADTPAKPKGPSDVKKWLKDNDLESFTELFGGIDASLFPALQNLREEAPEFFYRCLWEADDDRKIKRFIDTLKLTKALKDL